MTKLKLKKLKRNVIKLEDSFYILANKKYVFLDNMF